MEYILSAKVTNTMYMMDGLHGSQAARIIDCKRTGYPIYEVTCFYNIINAMNREHKRVHGVLNDVVGVPPLHGVPASHFGDDK